MIIKGMEFQKGILYMILQILASVSASLIYFQIYKLKPNAFPQVLSLITDMQALIFEFSLSFLYMFAYYSCVMDKRGPQHIFGFLIGAIMFFGVLLFGPYSGACVNPVRVLGIHLILGIFPDFGVYFFGSLAGSIFSAFYYS